MEADSDRTIARFGSLHPGFTLVDRQPIGLPFFELRLDVIAQKRHELLIIDENVLRFAHLGLRKPADVTGILGIDAATVRASTLSLLQADHIDYPPGADGREIRLTESGITVLEERMQEVPERTELRIGFDRLLWRLSPRWMNLLENSRVFKDTGYQLIKPIRGRRPELADVDLVAVNRTLADLPTGRREKIDMEVVQLLDLGARVKYLRAEMLIFVADDQSRIRASFVIDGHHSPDHDEAFVSAGGLARLGIELADPVLDDNELVQLPPEVESLRVDAAALQEMEQRVRTATRVLDEAIAGVEIAEVTENISARSATSTRERLRLREHELEALRTQLEEVKVAQRNIAVRSIQTYEHADLLLEALSTASRRLLVIAPWIKTEVVDDSFIRSLRSLCEKRIPIHIGYGFKKSQDEKNDAEALKRLSYLARTHENLVFRELGNTHAKVLIWDDQMVVTSFNWLSFRGDRRRHYRQEEGTYVGVASYVDTEYQRHQFTIESAK